MVTDQKKSNVTIRGRGIISGMRSFTDMKRFNLIHGNDVENVTAPECEHAQFHQFSKHRQAVI